MTEVCRLLGFSDKYTLTIHDKIKVMSWVFFQELEIEAEKKKKK